jgi:hypothetical protein
LIHSVDYIEGNSKARVKFWGVIDDFYNNNIEAHRHHTVKNLKDHWIAYNKQVFLFNQIYNKKSSNRQTRGNDGIVLENAKHRYKNRTGAKFKRFYWWEAVRYQPK